MAPIPGAPHTPQLGGLTGTGPRQYQQVQEQTPSRLAGEVPGSSREDIDASSNRAQPDLDRTSSGSDDPRAHDGSSGAERIRPTRRERRPHGDRRVTGDPWEDEPEGEDLGPTVSALAPSPPYELSFARDLLASNQLLEGYDMWRQRYVGGQWPGDPPGGVLIYNPFAIDIYPVLLERPARCEVEWKTWSVGSYHPVWVSAPRHTMRRSGARTYLAEGSIPSLLQAWNLCVLDATTRWGCLWCRVSVPEATPQQYAAAQMAMHLWTAHAAQVETSLWNMSPPVRSPIHHAEEQHPPTPWSADYLANRGQPGQVPTIYHYATPHQDE